MNLITCKNISFVYDGVPAVKDLDFSVEPNDYLCIVRGKRRGKKYAGKGAIAFEKASVRYDSHGKRAFWQKKSVTCRSKQRDKRISPPVSMKSSFPAA